MIGIPTLLPIEDPTLIMCCVMVMLLVVPLVCERIKVPPLVGMVLAGMAVGPGGFGLLARDDSFQIFGQVGLLYIMFTAGLSMDASVLKEKTLRMVVSGLMSWGVSFVIGFAVARWVLHLDLFVTIVIAAILSSHTMVAFSTVKRYGLAGHRSATLSSVMTMLSLILALVVIADPHYGPANASVQQAPSIEAVPMWVWEILGLAILGALSVFVLPMVVRWVFRHLADDVLQYIFVMALMLLMAGMADALGLEGVLGAFLAGLVLNRYIPPAAPLMGHIDFMGNALFIPYFLIGVGMLIDVRLILHTPQLIAFALVIVVIALATKCLSAWIVARIWKLDRDSLMMICGLTSAHAAGALAIVVAVRAPEWLLNVVVMLILVSCIFSAVLTQVAAKRLSLKEVSEEEQGGVEDKMLVVMHERQTMPELVKTAILMRPHRSTTPLVGVRFVVDAVGNEREIQKARTLVQEAALIAAAIGVNMKKVVRSSVNIITGLCHMMKDFETSEIMIENSLHPAWAGLLDIRCLLLILRSQRPINTIRMIHVVVPEKAEKEQGFIRWLNHVLRLARQTGCRIIFHCNDSIWPLIEDRRSHHYAKVRAAHSPFTDYAHIASLRTRINEDHMVVVVAARAGSISYQPSMAHLRQKLEDAFPANSLLLVYPDQHNLQSHHAAFTSGLK